MYIERKKGKYEDAFFIIRMPIEERETLMDYLTKGIKIAIKKEHQEEMIASIHFLEEMSHTRYDKENEISRIIHSSEISNILTSIFLSLVVYVTI